ncbi:TPA: UDP-N-acetylglucosamine diphosphorylase/glucosamine-1-phosphate N-acetyltransferase [Candidatus Dependentiae bacterium]|nr:MAG: Bifunctional protein GlmU [candidate division TM6 bacterium GW2011_GWF2_43_87]HBL98529.1 UDP-N-acetylglucosamine diphosphorylase/glucosamine-1-phosphate N-acetyltransferase [Candidatus Dependentiae bacterium]
MVRSGLQAIILAAGSSSRFNTSKSKLCFPICGQELIVYPAKLLASLQIPLTCVVGFQKEAVKAALARHSLPNISFAEQLQPLGTGHALASAREHFFADTILVMNGDAPLITQEIVETLLDAHRDATASVSFVISQSTDPSADGYGRIVQQDGKIRVVESRNYTGNRHKDQYINAGIYLFQRTFLEKALATIHPDAKTGEMYITDLIQYASNTNEPIITSFAPFDNIRGINTLKELWAAEHIKRSELITHWMSQGVRFIAAQNVYLDLDVSIGADTTISPGCILVNGSSIGCGCTLGAYSYVCNSVLHDQVFMMSHSIISDSIVHEYAHIGPFAQIRSSTIGERAVVGNFVEVNRSKIGNQSKAKHLTYLGDARIGNSVNIGAGTITCNYDGIQKHITTIKDRAFIGSNNALVAPIIVGEGAMTGAGSVITDDVPADALAIARSRQTVKENFVEQMRARIVAEKETPHTTELGA